MVIALVLRNRQKTKEANEAVELNERRELNPVYGLYYVGDARIDESKVEFSDNNSEYAQ